MTYFEFDMVGSSAGLISVLPAAEPGEKIV